MLIGCGSRPMVPFWGRCTTQFRAYFSGDWDVHWGYGILTHGQLFEGSFSWWHSRARHAKEQGSEQVFLFEGSIIAVSGGNAGGPFLAWCRIWQ